ncbi:metal-dependent transcriptional regulator [Clostridium aminobutyricum]|uniref:Manganese transport regulator n=1 Tax=Clostridium aminobutyricum TaxID=33953 RepID=A0A939D891_CLOAM|nr:metal-dependent transcriptional regulator [Clostridium aminobutyricum]MBN7773239.1 metal-dependent transcriptional regulator [Clostridium aminobutyricum]
MNERLSPTLENYIRAIYEVCDSRAQARVSDVAIHLNVTKSCVCHTTKKLVAFGMLERTRHKEIALTSLGIKYAIFLWKRIFIVKYFLVETIGVTIQAAELDACRIGHKLSNETLYCMRRIVPEVGKKISTEKLLSKFQPVGITPFYSYGTPSGGHTNASAFAALHFLSQES